MRSHAIFITMDIVVTRSRVFTDHRNIETTLNLDNYRLIKKTSRLFAASSGKTDLYPVYPKLVIVIIGVREKIIFHGQVGKAHRNLPQR